MVPIVLEKWRRPHFKSTSRTIIYDNDTNELIADLINANEQICVAQGGRHGIGNASFKSSVNRSPRRTIPGEEGERRVLRLELKC